VAISSLPINALPAFTGVLARELRFQPGALGAFASANAIGGVFGGALAVVLMRRVAPRATAMIGLLLLLLANAGSAAFGFSRTLVVLSAVGGLASGVTISACYYVFSLTDRERNIAGSLVAQTASAFAVFAALPMIVGRFGWRAMFVGLALLVIPCLLLARSFPDQYRGEETPERYAPGRAPAARNTLWLGLISVALCSLSILSVWTYLERMGASAGILQGTIATALSICTFLGLLSSTIVLRLGDRITGTFPLLLCLLLNILGIAASGSAIPWVYTVAISAFYFPLPIYLAAQFGAIMRRAPSKRFAAQYTLAGKVGVLGPAIGGLIADQYGFAMVRWLAVVLMAAAGALLWLGFIRVPPGLRVSSTNP
jgi:predicted MFS family arabinose efflux permease